MDSLVGYTGFVGSNLLEQHRFDGLYRSTNIQESFGTRPDLCVYSGVSAEMFLANSNPEKDLENIRGAMDNIWRIQPKRLVLISTIAVLDSPVCADENAPIDVQKLSPYGQNRRYLEQWVEAEYKNALIVRLPAIYGHNLKKNFIYDMIHISPRILTARKLEELLNKDDFIQPYYVLQPNGLYNCTDMKVVKPYFEHIGFNALHFTDSRSQYQFYHLKYLWEHIQYALARDIHLIHMATQPLTAAEVHHAVFRREFINTLANVPFAYDMRSLYFKSGYIFHRAEVLQDIVQFVEEHR